MMAQFVPVADNCSYTQSQRDAKGEFFRLVAEQGHYGGRTKPTATRQGLYTCTAEGELLASINHRDPNRVLDMMNQALEKWHQRTVPASQPDIPETYDLDPRMARWQAPEDGLVLNVYVRDLPRESSEMDPRMNIDRAWFTKEEARLLIPEQAQTSQTYPIPEHLARRVARFHLVDTARGESPRWRAEDIKKAEMTLAVENVESHRMKLRLEGRVRTDAQPSMAVNPFSQQKVDMARGIDLQLLGYLTYNQQTDIFDRFDAVAVGSRWGATTYNSRFDDIGPAPIGFAFELASDSAIDRTPPQAIRSNYFGES